MTAILEKIGILTIAGDFQAVDLLRMKTFQRKKKTKTKKMERKILKVKNMKVENLKKNFKKKMMMMRIYSLLTIKMTKKTKQIHIKMI